MSRVSYVMMNPGGDKELTKVVRGRLAKLTAELATAMPRSTVTTCSRSRSSAIRSCTTSCSGSIRPQLAAPRSPSPSTRRCACPRPSSDFPRTAGARAYFLPCIAGHVGADTAGVILSEEPHDGGGQPDRRRGHQRRDRAREPGPAARRLQPHGPGVRGSADEQRTARVAPGSDRAGTDRPRHARAAGAGDRLAMRGLGRAGLRRSYRSQAVCGSGIIEVARRAPSGRGAHDRRHDRRRTMRPAPPRLVASRPHLLVRAVARRAGDPDHRERRPPIQFAKAGLHAGARLLMDRSGIDASTGSSLRAPSEPRSIRSDARALGLVPDCEPPRGDRAGNAQARAGESPSRPQARAEIQAVVRRVEKIETAVEPCFQEHFVAGHGVPARRRSGRTACAHRAASCRGDPAADGERRRRRGKRENA